MLDDIATIVAEQGVGTIEIRRANKLVVRYTTGSRSYLCGYVEFPKSQIPERWWDDFTAEGLKYLRVHGGITHVATDETTIVFGLDCAHAGDNDNPDLQNSDHVYRLVEDMETLISIYASRIQAWRAASPHDRMAIIDEINSLAQFREEFGTLALVDMLRGGPTFQQIDPFARVRERPVRLSLFRRICNWFKKML